MERQALSKRIGLILDDISRLSNALYAMDTTDIQRYPDNYEVLSIDAALRSEKVACQMRHLVYTTTNTKKSEYIQSAGVIHGINIENNEGIFEITLPCLLPKRKHRQGTEFLIDPIYAALDQYTTAHEVKRFNHCVVCFSHIYCRDLPKGKVRDYDNLELKQILDAIATFIMVDDSGALCDAYNTTEYGETDYTRISVMDKNVFANWLEKRKNSLKSICDF